MKMAEKRMFSKQIIDSDAFLDMPLSAQALYFHLAMRADDDGFIDNPKKIQKIVNASIDDLKLLLMKRYILSFDSGVIVIKHWRIHNTIQRDRYKPTVYSDELSELKIKENKSYTEANKDLYTECIQNGNTLETQIRLDKNRLDKNSIKKDILCSPEDERLIASKDNFEKIYALYPKKTGKAKALEYYMQWHKGRKLSGFDKAIKLTNKQMYLATMKYVAEKKDTETDLQYYKGFDVFMNKAILDYLEEQNE
jgi:hypothetical protein